MHYILAYYQYWSDWAAMEMKCTAPPSLTETFRWAHKCLEWHKTHSPSPWLMRMKQLPTSSWFSGYGCAEMAMTFINQAMVDQGGNTVFEPAYQFEIQSRARACCADRIPKSCCQFIDIARLMPDATRKQLKEVEKTWEIPSTDAWKFLEDVVLESTTPCTSHQMRFGSFLPVNYYAHYSFCFTTLWSIYIEENMGEYLLCS